jgi:hypothetical protein
MRKRQVLPILLVTCAFSAAGALAGAPGVETPCRFNPGLDGAPVYATDSSSGATWAAWAYRWRGEFDIALSMRSPGGAWGDPTFIGRLDGLDQGSPALASDAAGNLYLAFAVRQTGRVYLSGLARGASVWSAPELVTIPGERGSAPALAVVADRLVLAYRTADGKVALRVRPVIADGVQPYGIYDNPDGTDPLGFGGTTPPSGSGGNSGVPGGGSPTDILPPSGGGSPS